MSLVMARAIAFKTQLLLKNIVLGYLLAGVACIALNFIPHNTAIIVNSFFILTVFMTFYCHLGIKAAVIEVKEHNWQFLMSLPLSARFLLLSTLGFNWAIFMGVWIIYLACIAGSIVWSQHIPSMVLSLYILIFMLYPIVFAFILSASLIFQKEAATIVSFVLGNSIATALISLISNNSEIQQGFAQGTFHEVGWLWPSWTVSYVSLCCLITLVILCITVIIGWRRKYFC